MNRHYEVDENAGITTVQLEYCQPACHVTPAPAVSSLVDQEHRAYFITVDGDDWGVYEREGTQAPIPEEGDSYVRAPAYGRKDCYPISAGTTVRQCAFTLLCCLLVSPCLALASSELPVGVWRWLRAHQKRL